MAKNATPEKFVPKKIKIQVDEKDHGKKEVPEVTEEDEVHLKRIYDELINAPTAPEKAPTVVEFEKDDPTNWHIEFMGGVSNLRARNYKIE